MKDYEYRDENGNLLDYYTIVNDATQMLREIDEKDKEIERLNNIINELEKWLEETQELTCICETTINYINAYENVLKKLKELKEGK